jgi:hypothetical protein
MAVLLAMGATFESQPIQLQPTSRVLPPDLYGLKPERSNYRFRSSKAPNRNAPKKAHKDRNKKGKP